MMSQPRSAGWPIRSVNCRHVRPDARARSKKAIKPKVAAKLRNQPGLDNDRQDVKGGVIGGLGRFRRRTERSDFKIEGIRRLGGGGRVKCDMRGVVA